MRRAILMIILLSILTACASEPAYTPDAATLAAREQQEYDTRISRWTWTWRAFYTAFVLILTVLVFLAAALGQTVYRIHAARASIEEARARASWVIGLGDGQAVDLLTGQMVTRIANQPEAVRMIAVNSPQRVEPARSSGVWQFVLDAAKLFGGNITSFPRWDQWQAAGQEMDADDWVRYTSELVGLGLITKRQGVKNSIVGGDLNYLIRNLPHPDEMDRL